MDNFFDTIAAPATPLSKGSIGIIRISGENALFAAQKIFSKQIKPDVINRGFVLIDGKKTDEAVVLYFKSPKSYTGEDIIEFQLHGSPIIIKTVLDEILKNGVRLANKGEFTKRAFLNGKIDLSKAEAVLDLIEAKTAKSASKSASNLSGALSEEISNIKEIIFTLFAKITASIDFPEDVKEVSKEEITKSLTLAKEKIENILKSAKSHNILREGIKIALAGRPNAGKSSLFNALLNLKRAIVTDIAGTTRDIITEGFEIEGIFCTLIDTAGIRRDSEGEVEKIGINQAKETIEDADIVLLLFDGTIGIEDCDREIFELAKNKKNILIAAKSDISNKKYQNALPVSSKTGKNIDKLREMIYQAVLDNEIDDCEFTTNQRQQECLKNALLGIENAFLGVAQDVQIDLISIDIKSALLALGEISGEVINDEILNSIFDKFCIGK